MRKVKLHDLTFRPMISKSAVQKRVKEIGAALDQEFFGKKPLFIGVLNGAFVFMADLVRQFSGDCEVVFVKLTSYSGTESSGKVETVLGIEKSPSDGRAGKIEGRHVVVVEDILDSGRTLHFFLEHLSDQKPASLSTVVFLRKPTAAAFLVEVAHVGFDIENKFVVGYGLDYNGLGRNLPKIYVLDK